MFDNLKFFLNASNPISWNAYDSLSVKINQINNNQPNYKRWVSKIVSKRNDHLYYHENKFNDE